MNPDHVPLCLGTQQQSVSIPVRVNQSTPILIEVLHFDLNTGKNDTITFSNKQLKQLRKKQPASTTGGDLQLPVKKPGIYRLSRVVDESNLEVQTKVSDALVPVCPKASTINTQKDRCKGDLSDIILEVEGAPPLKIKYVRKVNGLDGGFSGVISSDRLDRVVVEWCFAQRSPFCVNRLCSYRTPAGTLILVTVDRLAHLLPAVFSACVSFACKMPTEGTSSAPSDPVTPV